ncbi:hypothetical protein [Pedobacter caeni]|uniref:Uncharacterized protein n=1 Tax=Pedobacter caeni TaxID=288992 RepID=A0A1M5BVL8_9SPHI|nr:hypothetical protein [Pedobacter caeni]SHF46548.1 hypothetical protein SAMN04488522_1021375 [Pedobacter caeni]
MVKASKPFLFVTILCCAMTTVYAQHSFNLTNIPGMTKYQDSLVSLGDRVQNAENNTERFALNAQFIKTLVNALKTPSSAGFPFDSLKRISILPSPDKTFRIFSWSLPLDDGTYRFFGAIQMATKDGKLKLYPLIDGTENLKDPNAITSNKNWYGANYYEIVPVTSGGKTPYYVLIGWKGNSAKTSKKLIDVLSFEKGEPVFGKAIFDQKQNPGKNRMIFEYNKLNSMTITMEKSMNMIVFDHLAPFNPEMKGNFEYYASDLSFDGYKITGGKLKLVENVELKNAPNDKDEFYVDPKNKKIQPIKKL